MTIPDMLKLACSRYRYRSNVAYRMKEGTDFRTLTYGDMERQAAAFGAGLIAMGLRQGDRVAIVCENCFEWVIGYYGQCMAGAVGVPVHAELKGREIEEMIRWAEARFVIASARVLSKIKGDIPGVETVIGVGGDLRVPGRAGNSFLQRGRANSVPFHEVAAAATQKSYRALAATRVEPDDLASIVFTSGTTGGTKGVMLTHRNIVSNVHQRDRHGLDASERDRLLVVLPLHHVFPFTFAVVGLLTVGAAATFENDLLRLRERLNDVRPTALLGVPALFEAMYRAIETRIEAEGQKRRFKIGLRIVTRAKDLTGVNIGRIVFRRIHKQLGGELRVLICGGAPLSADLALKYFHLGIPIMQGWGLSETAPVAAMQRLCPRRFQFTKYYEKRVGSVGSALPDVEIRVVDVPEKGIFVRLHGEGELVVRGPNVSRGYWKAPEETSRAMKSGWFHTGDLGRIDKENNVWITGRAKYVIVLDSGEKVVPDELEDRLASSPLIEDICVVPRRVRNKTMVGAIIYPSLEGVVGRCQAENIPLIESNVRRLVESELNKFGADMAPFKRVNEILLSSFPLPRTDTRNIARCRIKDSYSFDLKRWRRAAADAQVAAGESIPAGPGGI
ncbi:MAG: AMP-binding protein [Dehalococcoidia bacterium]|jgi:long-chain acyl-CoA synthetase